MGDDAEVPPRFLSLSCGNYRIYTRILTIPSVLPYLPTILDHSKIFSVLVQYWTHWLRQGLFSFCTITSVDLVLFTVDYP